MLDAISPIDGRYANSTMELKSFFSEESIIKYRVKIEIEYLIALSGVGKIKELKPLPYEDKTELRKIYGEFSTNDAKQIKKIEEKTNHDVKAVEYFIDEKFTRLGLGRLIPWVHFALTSEDVNNLAYSLMWQDGLKNVYLPTLKKLMARISSLAEENKNTPLLALTHGQPASPTTIGKELAVFHARLHRQLVLIEEHKLYGKLSGATGTWGAHLAAYPKVDWLEFSNNFIKSLKLEPNLITTQIESHDSHVESYHTLTRINSILIDFCQDLWQYISRGIFKQKRVANEVGSSAMPHKINPINFENAEGNLGISNALLLHFSSKLPVSRMQRDLSDSTVLRNQGVALAHSLLAIINISKGLDRLAVNKEKTLEELNSHWEVLAEAIQTVLRKNGMSDAYEKLKELTRGKELSKEIIQKFIGSLDLPKTDKEYLLTLTPETYTGLSSKLVELI